MTWDTAKHEAWELRQLDEETELSNDEADDKAREKAEDDERYWRDEE